MTTRRRTLAVKMPALGAARRIWPWSTPKKLESWSRREPYSLNWWPSERIHYDSYQKGALTVWAYG